LLASFASSVPWDEVINPQPVYQVWSSWGSACLGSTDATGVATLDTSKIAWFKDSEGNILAVEQRL
jgi:hypothetical protein